MFAYVATYIAVNSIFYNKRNYVFDSIKYAKESLFGSKCLLVDIQTVI